MKTLLKQITNLSAEESFLGADLVNEKMRQLNKPKNSQDQKWKSACDEPEKLFAEFGWQTSVVQFGDDTASFGRFKHKFPPREVPDIARGFLVTARKKA